MEKELNIIIQANPFLDEKRSHREPGPSTAFPSRDAVFIWQEFVIANRLVPILRGTNKKAMEKYLHKQIDLCECDIAQADRLEREYEDIIYRKSNHPEFWREVCNVCFLNPLRVRQEKIIKRNRLLLSDSKVSANGVTPEQIARAKAFPITELIVFKHRQSICPFHNETQPSMYYYPATNTCHCFGACQKSFDSIELYRRLYNVSFVEAVRKLQ